MIQRAAALAKLLWTIHRVSLQAGAEIEELFKEFKTHSAFNFTSTLNQNPTPSSQYQDQRGPVQSSVLWKQTII